MIPADSSIDDELPLFPVSLNGKKDCKDTNVPKTRTSSKQLVLSTPFPKNLKDQRWDPMIPGSGHHTDKSCRFPGAWAGDVLEGFGQTRDKDDKSNTLRAKPGLPRCMSAMSFMSWHRFLPVKDI